ncbi:reverse transcriptase domain-containing protein [Tanacetum coccineum]
MEICSLADEEAKIEEWTLYTDGASSVKGVGAGLVLIDPSGTEHMYAIRRNLPSTNNEAEYEALLAGLHIAQKMKVQALKVKVDSKLVACQLNGEFVVSSERMTKYLTKAKDQVALFKKFGLPRVIMTDNGTQLVNNPFKSWGEKWKIKKINTVVAHPQANGLVERANKSLMHGLKARLGRERVGWVNKLPNILWAHQTMLKISNGKTTFSLTNGSEVVILAKIGMPTYRTIQLNEAQNEEMSLNLDLIQERREASAIQEAKYKKKMEQYYNKQVWPVSFRVEDFVYQRNEASRVENQGKLSSNWEGPYRVVKAYGNGSYKLCTMNDREVPHTWHAINLRNCFM